MHGTPSAPSATTTADTSATAAILGTLLPFLSLFATRMNLARDYGAILMSGNHTSVVFQELAGVLNAEIERILHKSGMHLAIVPVVIRPRQSPVS